MKIIKNIPAKKWSILMQRPTIENEKLTTVTLSILNAVKTKKDAALKEYAFKFDNVNLDSFEVSEAEINKAINMVALELKEAINIAKSNIEKFHLAQQPNEAIIETTSGVQCWRKNVGIEKVGLYIPGGSAPLFSTILMLGIPARIAQCKEVVLCTPCDSYGEINPAILYTANLIGIQKIYKIGGAQAIAAMAYGTETIPNVYKIFGPGNQYVTKAKELIQQEGVAIDIPAGPSELLIIADNSSYPQFIAADLLSQAEHGIDSQVILLSDNEQLITKVISNLEQQIRLLPRAAIANKALENSKFILLDNLSDCFDFSNQYAPEHLIVASTNAEKYSSKIINAGSVFLGNYTPESAGDYASGTNHTLPTNGFAKNYSGVSLDSFVKKITFQKISKTGIKNIGKAIEVMASAEELIAHKNAVSIRLKEINNV